MPAADQIRSRVAAALTHHPRRPLAIAGRTGSGKTTLLRALAAEGDRHPVWCPAVDLAGLLVEAVRSDRYAALRASIAADPQPLVVEHLEDLRGKPRTRAELRSLLEAASRRRPVVLTLTRARSDGDVFRWLRRWAEVISLD
jgi:chromosomal replication initiation ATPase DnaA